VETHSPALDAAALLRGARLRVTAPRATILQLLAEEPHSSVETLMPRARDRIGGLSVQGLYDVLGALTRSGLVRRIEPAGSPARYETRVGDNHHHVVCRRCGAAADVDCAVGAAPCLEPSASHGFLLDEAEVTFWGLCPVCRDETGAAQVRGQRATGRRDPAHG
jgi:Fur family ferric uptake transcriptional regulator